MCGSGLRVGFVCHNAMAEREGARPLHASPLSFFRSPVKEKEYGTVRINGMGLAAHVGHSRSTASFGPLSQTPRKFHDDYGDQKHTLPLG